MGRRRRVRATSAPLRRGHRLTSARTSGGVLISQGHDVVLHARSRERAAALSDLAADAAGVVIGDLSSAAETRDLAGQVNQIGRMDAVIHNAGVFLEPSRSATADGHAKTLAVNAAQAYAESKLHVTALALTLARVWPEVLSNAVDPGWVPTKMGGPAATGDLQMGYLTQIWLAVSNDAAATVSGGRPGALAIPRTRRNASVRRRCGLLLNSPLLASSTHRLGEAEHRGMVDHPERWSSPFTQVEMRRLWTYSDGALTAKGYRLPNGTVRAGSWVLVDQATGNVRGVVPPGEFSRRFRPVDLFAYVPGLHTYLGTVTASDGTALVDLVPTRRRRPSSGAT